MSKPILAMIPSAYNTNRLYSVLPFDSSGDFTFDRLGNVLRINKNGLLETVPQNNPRLDYSDGSCPSLLLEPQRTNYLSNSDFIGLSSGTAPILWNVASGYFFDDGTDTIPPSIVATKMRCQGVSGEKGIITQNISVSAVDYTFSFYTHNVVIDDYPINEVFNVIDVSVSSFTWYEDGVEVNGTDFLKANKRYSVTFRFLASGTATILFGSNVLSSSSSFDHTLSKPQLEQGLYVTSYINTFFGSASRNADNCYGAGDVNLFDTTLGTLFVDITPYLSKNSPYYISMSDGSYANRFSLFFYNSQQIRFYVVGDGSISVNAYHAIPFNERMKIAVTFRQNEFYFYVNGNLITKDTLGNIPIGLDRINFSAYYNSAYFEGKVHEARFYNEVLSTTELATLTTL